MATLACVPRRPPTPNSSIGSPRRACGPTPSRRGDGWDEERARHAFNPTTHQIIRYQERDAGVLECFEDSECVVVDSLYIMPSCQNRGIGAQVMRALMNNARAANKPIELTVLVVIPARRFYERLGFSVVQSTTERHHMVWHPRDHGLAK